MERRKHKRYEFTFSVKFKNKEAFIEAFTRDISKGGLFIKSRVFPRINSTVKLNLYLPHTINPLEVEGRVVYIIDEEKAKKLKTEPGFGVEFMNLSEEAKEAIDYLIEELQRRERTIHGRRRSPRMPYETRVIMRVKGAEIEGRSYDISLFGVFVSVPLKGLKPGEVVELICEQLGFMKNVCLKGRIVHFLDRKKVKEVGKEEGYGIEFVDLPDEVYREIYALMERWIL